MADTEPPVKSLLDKLPAQHVSPLWTAMQAMVPSKPAPKAKVALWKYEELRPLLLEAGQTVSSAEAERRVLMLTNPALEPPFTTDTIFAGLQLINKGETAPAHRHRAFALRFIIEGNGGFSVVDGEKVHMEEGDVVITPPWQWHDHGHEGSGPMIWLDGLDLPLYHKLPTHFAEYQESRYPSVPVASSTLRLPWVDMKAKLDADSRDWCLHHYRDSHGNYVSATLSAHAERIKAGKRSESRRDTCAYIYHVREGSGTSDITTAAGENIKLCWQQHDTFAVPAWSRIVHESDAHADSYLFVLSDRPLLQALKMYSVES